MRKINANEKRLLLIFMGAMVVLGNLVLLRQGLNLSSQYQNELASLREELANDIRLEGQAEYWEARSLWRKQNPLPVFDPGKSDSLFVEKVQQSLTASGLTIQEQQIKDSQRQDGFVATVLFLKVTGNLEGHIRWMAGMQKPGNHLRITKFTLKSSEDASSMTASMELSQFFSPPGLAAAP